MNINLTMNTDLAGIRIPDSKLAREITELVRDREFISGAVRDPAIAESSQCGFDRMDCEIAGAG
jgi:hypothetical protein